MSTKITQVPDYAAQARALEKAAQVEARARGLADSILSSSLGASTFGPGSTLSGYLFFDSDSVDKAVFRCRSATP